MSVSLICSKFYHTQTVHTHLLYLYIYIHLKTWNAHIHTFMFTHPGTVVFPFLGTVQKVHSRIWKIHTHWSSFSKLQVCIKMFTQKSKHPATFEVMCINTDTEIRSVPILSISMIYDEIRQLQEKYHPTSAYFYTAHRHLRKSPSTSTWYHWKLSKEIYSISR